MRPVLGIFAHPDDEAFGPGGTLATFAKERDVYLICVTNGDGGQNSSKKTQELGEIRKQELLASSKVNGIKEVFFLDYKDGSLCHNLYHEIAEKVKEIVERVQPEILLTYEPRGVSGHLDHMAVSMITSYIFEKTDVANEIWKYCITDTVSKLFQNYFIHFPTGYKKSEITKTIDTSGVWEQKVRAMHEHESQAHDIERILSVYKDLPKEENFLIITK